MKSLRNLFIRIKVALVIFVLTMNNLYAQALDELAGGIEEDLLGGRWRIIFVAVMILAVGFLFATGRLAWYWALAILIGVMLIAGALDISEWLFEIFEG